MSNEEQVIGDKEQTVVEQAAQPDESAEQAQAQADGGQAEAPVEHNEEVVDAQNDVSENAVEKKSEKREKSKPAKSKREAKGKSKMFKLIYYPALALVALVFMIFSIVDGVCGYSPEEYGSGYYKAVNAHIEALAADERSSMSTSGIDGARDYIVSALTANDRFRSVDEVKEGEDDEDSEITTVTDWAGNSSAVATVTVMTSVPSIGLQNSAKSDGYYVGKQITNIVAAVPSKSTRKAHADNDYDGQGGAVIVTVRYDSRTGTSGAASNASFVSVAIETLRDIVERDVGLENDLVVVFTEELGSAYGVYTFFESFKGLDDVVSRAKVGISLDAYGNDGTLALTDASGAGLSYISAYAGISGSAFNSSLVPASIPDAMKSNAVAGFGDIPALQVAVVGGLDSFGSAYDTANNVSSAIINQQSAFFKNFVEKFAQNNAEVDGAGDGENVFFSYFDWGTVSYGAVASYVIGAIILVLLGVNIALLAVKKTFSLKKLFTALGVQLLVVAGTLATMFVAYFLIALMLTGFGVLPIHAITQVRYFNGGILTAAMFISLASAFGFTTLLKKLFKVTSSDTVRGTAVMFGIVGAIMSFAAPAFSMLASWLGLLLTAVMLVTVCLNGKLKERFGIGFDRLFIYVVPVIICMPFVLSGLTMVTQLLPLYMLPVTMMLFTGMLGVIVPYLDRTRALFDKVAKKLPKRTQRVQRVVTERVEDRAKKGKFTEREVKRVQKEKVAINYKNYFGVSLIAVIGVVIALFSGGFGATFSATITDAETYYDGIYNDSLVYEWNGTSQKIIVKDLMAYKFARYAVNDLEWDAENKYYYKNVNYNANEVLFTDAPSVSKDGDVYNVKSAYGSHSSVVLTISSASRITAITVTPTTGDSETDGMTYNFFEEDEIVLRLPCGYADGSFSLDIEGDSSVDIAYEERYVFASDNEADPLGGVDEWNAMVREYNGKDVLDALRGGIILKTKSA